MDQRHISGRSRQAMGYRSLGPEKVRSSGYVTTECDFTEQKDTDIIYRNHSFARKPSVRSFEIGLIPPPTPAHVKHARKTALRRSNAVRLGPIQYLKHVFRQFRLRMRLRRHSTVTFKHSGLKGTRKRSYILSTSTMGHRYKLSTRDLFKRKPKVRNPSREISGPINPLQGAEALAVAERGKNQKFNIQSYPPVKTTETRGLPKRYSQVSRPSHSRAGLLLPQPPELEQPTPGAINPESDTEYEDPDELLANSVTNRVSLIQPDLRTYEESPVDIEDALDFVNSWGSYLQRIVVSRAMKERELRMKELQEERLYYNAPVSPQDASGYYDSCTSECFAASSDWTISDEEATHSYISNPPSMHAPNPPNAPPMPPPHVPLAQHALAPAPTPPLALRTQERRVPSGPRPMSVAIVPPEKSPARKLARAPVRSSSHSPGRASTQPLNIASRRISSYDTSNSNIVNMPISAPRSHKVRESASSDEFNFGATETLLQAQSSWIANSRSSSPASRGRASHRDAVIDDGAASYHSGGPARSNTVTGSGESRDPLITAWNNTNSLSD